jgi:methylthioribulose-1-phosphate dehydratase
VNAPMFDVLADELAAVGRRFYERGWVLGTSGNFSAVVSRAPTRLAITPSTAHKGKLVSGQILEIDDLGDVVDGHGGRPSAETLLHLEIVKRRGAGAVLHTHSVWSTMLSGIHEAQRGLAISGYEMLKGLSGVTTHLHREWIPIVGNDQDMKRLSREVHEVLTEHSDVHAFVIARHGLYTWGETLADAERHVEILEFLFEVIGRTHHGPDSHSG